MFIKKLPYLLVTLLMAIVIGCGSSNPLAGEAEDNLKNQDFEAAISSAEKSIEKYPGDPLGYYYKGVALGELAGAKDDPSERGDQYKEMNEVFEMARSIADTSESVPGEIDRIDGVRVALWQNEFQSGIDLATDDSVMNTVDNPMERSLHHLRNATIIEPDSASSWNVLAQIAAQNKEFEEAASAKERYMDMIPESDADTLDFLQLGNYYFNLEEHEKVVEALEKGSELYPENQQIVSSLADAYGQIGEEEKSISVLEDLVQQEPENARYRLVMGTKIYQQAMRIRDDLAENSKEITSLQEDFREADQERKEEIKSEIEEISQENEEMITRMEELTDRAEEEVQTALEYDPEEPGAAYETLGVIYQNRAELYFDQRNRTNDNEEAEKFNEMGQENIRQARDYYEKATEIDPENENYWRSLFQIYTFLGEDEKAQEAMEKAGMND